MADTYHPAPRLAQRLTRRFTQRIHATPEQVFPLLCPEREKEWLPGWNSRMIHSASGVAELGAVFETTHGPGRTLWLVTRHDAPHRVSFARWQPDDLLVRIEIAVMAAAPGESAVQIEYYWTSVGSNGEAALTVLTEAAWLENMTNWERSMNAWLAAQESPMALS
jgi:hypothetical protein